MVHAIVSRTLFEPLDRNTSFNWLLYVLTETLEIHSKDVSPHNTREPKTIVRRR